jgi:hypothetical protein
MTEYNEPEVSGYPIEILSLVKGCLREIPMALLTVRPDQEEFLPSLTLFFTREQSVFIRDTLNDFLNDENSWLYLPEETQQLLRVQEEDEDIPF